MRLFLYGISAFSQWLVSPGRPSLRSAVGAESLRDCHPSSEAIAYCRALLPSLPAPLEVLTPGHSKSPSSDVVIHSSTYSFKGKPFFRIGSGLFSPNPELCFIQLARSMPLLELIKAGSVLCGAFHLDAHADYQLAERPPLTSPRKIASFIKTHPNLPGTARARKALPHLVRNAASPPEIFLGLVLTLPYRYGGYQLPDLASNRRIRSSKKAQRIAGRGYLIPDFCHQKHRLAIEYDSNAEHMTSRQITRDATKRLALEADGYQVITVTARQLSNQAAMKHVASQAARRMGLRLKPQSKFFPERHAELFRIGWSLDPYCVNERPAQRS